MTMPGFTAPDRRAAILLAASISPVHLTTAEAQATFKSGKDVRQWAKDNGIKMIVNKGSVTL